MSSIETGAIMCRDGLCCHSPSIQKEVVKIFRRAPMFVFEFENVLFEFEYATPH